MSEELEIAALSNKIIRANHILAWFKAIYPIAASPIVFCWLLNAIQNHWAAEHCHSWILWVIVLGHRLGIICIKRIKRLAIGRICEISDIHADIQASRLLLTELTACSRNQVIYILRTLCRMTEQIHVRDRIRIATPVRRFLLNFLRESQLPVFSRYVSTEVIKYVLHLLVLYEDIESIIDVERLSSFTKRSDVRALATDTLQALRASATARSNASSLLRASAMSSIRNEKALLLPAGSDKGSENIETLLRSAQD